MVKGARVEARYVADPKAGFVAVSLKVTAAPPAPKPDLGPRQISGLVTAVDATDPAKSSITVKPTDGKDPLTIKVNQKTRIYVDGAKGELAKVVVSPPSPAKVIYRIVDGAPVADLIVVGAPPTTTAPGV